MKLTILNSNQSYNCEAVTRTDANNLEIMAYLPDDEGNPGMIPSPVKFIGISDMTQYKITDGDNEYTAADLPVPITDAQRLQAMETALLEMAGEIYG